MMGFPNLNGPLCMALDTLTQCNKKKGETAVGAQGRSWHRWEMPVCCDGCTDVSVHGCKRTIAQDYHTEVGEECYAGTGQ